MQAALAPFLHGLSVLPAPSSNAPLLAAATTTSLEEAEEVSDFAGNRGGGEGGAGGSIVGRSPMCSVRCSSLGVQQGGKCAVMGGRDWSGGLVGVAGIQLAGWGVQVLATLAT